MADSLDALKFDAIIDDKEFKASVDRITNEARRLNTDVSRILTFNAKIQSKQIITSQGVKNAEAMVGYLKDIESRMSSLSGKKFLVGDADALNETLQKVLEKMDSFSDKSEKSKGSIKGINTELSKSQGLMQTLAQLTGVTFGLAGIRSFLSGLVRVTGEFEVQKMALTSMLQDAGKAEEIFGTLRQRALESPYTFQDLTKYAKQLTAFNIDADKLVETEKRLADVAAGLGVDMGRIILAYGQVKAAGVLKGTELRQFTEAGVPLLQSLADQIKEVEGKTISLSEVFSRISKKQIPFEMVEEAFRRMTDEGGKFYNMQEVLVNTLQGKIGKLRDVWQQMLYDMGSSNNTLKWSVDLLTNLASNFDKIAQLIAPLVAAWGMYKVAVAACVSIQKALLGAETIAGLLKLTKATKALGTAMEAVKVSALGVSAALGVVALLGTAIYVLTQRTREARAEQEKYNDALETNTNEIKHEIEKLDALKDRLEKAKKGTKEYNDAKTEIVNNYGKYYDGLNTEIDKVGSLKTAYDKLTESVEFSIRARGYSEFESSEKRIFDEAIGNSAKYVKNNLSKRKDLKNNRWGVEKIMNEVNSLILSGKTYEDFTKTNVFDEYFKAGSYVGDIKQFFNTAKNARNDYLKNTRQAIKDYGLKNTVFDPDFTGPLPSPTKNEPTTTNNWGGTTDDKAAKEAKENIKTVIDSIKELQRAYKDFKEMGLDDDDILQIFAKEDMFGYLDKNLRTRLDYWDMLLEQADEMEKYDENAAKEIRADVARGKADEAKKAWKDAQEAIKKAQKEQENAQKAVENFQKELDKWEKEWGGKYSGFNAVVEKEFVKYKNEDKKIDDEYIEALNKAFDAYKDDTDALKEYTDQLYEYYLVRKKANEENARKSVSGFVDDYVKEATSSMSLKDWGDKSIKQVYDIWKSLKALRDEEIVDGLQIGDDDLFADLTFEKFSELTAEAKEELKKKLGSLIKEITGDFKDAAQSVREFAEATGNLNLVSAIDDMMSLGDAIATVASRALGGDWIGAITAGLSFLVKSLFDARIESAKLEASLSAMREESRGEQFSSMLSSGVDSIFGTNDLQKVENAVAVIDKARKSMAKYASMEFNTTKKGFWSRIFSSEKFNKSSIEDMAKAVGGDLYDAYGNLNAETLQTILDTYDKLDTEQREWIEHAINDSEAYADAMKQVEDVAESIIGSVVSNVADKLVDSWWEAGEAALDYADILGDVAKAYAKLVVQDLLLQAAFDEDRQKAFVDALKNGDASTAMAVVEQAMQSASDMLPIVNDALQAFEPYRNMASETLDSNSVGSGFKSITEDTANLLASYFNAARADVSVMRGLQETGWKNVAAIAETVASPTLNDYLAQIAATNFDIAQSSQSILSELQSVIGSPGTSGMVVRVEYA